VSGPVKTKRFLTPLCARISGGQGMDLKLIWQSVEAVAAFQVAGTGFFSS
jgi:hypothetical protein